MKYTVKVEGSKVKGETYTKKQRKHHQQTSRRLLRRSKKNLQKIEDFDTIYIPVMYRNYGR